MAMPAFFRAPAAAASDPEPPECEPRLATDSCVLRDLPHERIFLFAKKIDNSRLVREADPRADGACWTTVGAAAVLFCALTAILAPSVAGTLAGYRLESLRTEERRLLQERKLLDLEEARLLNPARLEELARRHNLVAPSRGQVTRLDGKTDSSLALAK